MKKKYLHLKSILVLLLIVLAFVGGTYAWFTDSATNEGNRIQAGNLKVAFEASETIDGTYRDISSSADPVFDYGDNAEPGDGPYVSYIKVSNIGNIPMNYRISFIVVEDALASVVSFEIEKVFFNGDTNDYTTQTITGDLLGTHYLEGSSLGLNDYEIYKVTMSFTPDDSYNLDPDDVNFPLAYEFDMTLYGWQEEAPDPFA